MIGKIASVLLEPKPDKDMTTWQRYLRFQIPGWLLAVALFALVRHWNLLAEWLALLALLAWVIKDFALYPFVRLAYETKTATGSQLLVGAKGVVAQDLAPEGYVRVRGELWRAVPEATEQQISAGTPVEILKVERMKIFVRPLPASSRR